MQFRALLDNPMPIRVGAQVIAAMDGAKKKAGEAMMVSKGLLGASLLTTAAWMAPACWAQSQPASPTVEASAVRSEADRMAAAIVARMTLDEKLGQMLNVAPAIPRL